MIKFMRKEIFIVGQLIIGLLESLLDLKYWLDIDCSLESLIYYIFDDSIKKDFHWIL
jgi:hypothetical protein